MHFRLGQKIIDKLRRKKTSAIRAFQKKNKLLLPKDFDLNKLQINIDGENNVIKINKNAKILEGLNICGYCDNSLIEIGEDFTCRQVGIQLGQNHPYFGKIKNCSFKIGNNTKIESMNYTTMNSNTYCDIEKDCMFASGVIIYNTDAHPIFRKGTKEIINKVKGVTIGEHSWLCKNVVILKNSFVPKNSIIGYGAVFSGGGAQPFCVFAGNPARIVKENVEWDANGRKYGYIDNE